MDELNLDWATIEVATYKMFLIGADIKPKYPSIGDGVLRSWCECAILCLQNKNCASFCFVMSALLCQLSQIYGECLNDVRLNAGAKCFGRSVTVGKLRTKSAALWLYYM